ncbi:hypothetical protein KEJ52_06560 [Candidatus Bathyarchaeota archaeon]|nr:hypothetical protein [Candidatus Bathyarchaeota archaeon]
MSRWKTVLAAVGFNLLFEYSMRGINNLAVRPLLPFFLFLVYFPYFALLEDLIARHRLKDYNVAIAGFFFGTAFTLFVPATQFVEPQLFGVNWTALLFVNIFWWAILQGVLTFYIATRLFPRDWNHKPFSKGQKTTLVLMLIFVGLLCRISIQSNVPAVLQIRPEAYVTITVLLIVTAFIFKKTVPKQETPISIRTREKVIDLVAVATMVVFAFCAVFLTRDPIHINVHEVNATAVRVVTAWTILADLIVLGHRIYTRRPIPV